MRRRWAEVWDSVTPTPHVEAFSLVLLRLPQIILTFYLANECPQGSEEFTQGLFLQRKMCSEQYETLHWMGQCTGVPLELGARESGVRGGVW